MKPYFSRLAVKELVAGDRQAAPFRQADAKWRAIKKAVEASFDATWAGNAPYGWEVGGQRYLRIDEAAVAEWRRLRGDVPGVGFYAALSMYMHPQSLPEELATDEETGAPVLNTDVEFIAKCAMNTLVYWVDGARVLCCDYHGWDVPELDDIGDAAAGFSAPR